jgi:hypothetical protein
MQKRPWVTAQGTIEYLVILSIVIVLALVVVGLLSQTIGAPVSNISSTTNKISQVSGAISISDAVVDLDRNGLISLKNNSGGNLIITKLSLNGIDVNYSNIPLSQGDSKIFGLDDVGGYCSCDGFVGSKKTCELTVYGTSEYGVEKIYSVNINVDCVVDAKSIDQNKVISPSLPPVIPFTITIHGAASLLTDYQIQTIIPYKVGMKADFGDVKFKDQSNIDLNYWIEDYNSTRAIFWIKVPNIPASVDTNIYGTYRDSNRTLDSNGFKVFVDFDDFADDSLTGWNTQTGGGSISESGGKLRISCTNGGNNCDWYGGLNASPKIWRTAPVGDYAFQAKWTYGPIAPVDMSNRLGMFISGNPTGSAGDSKFTGIADTYLYYPTQVYFAWGSIGAETGTTINYTSQTVQSRIRKIGVNYYSDYLLGDTNWQGNTNMGSSTATYFGLLTKNFSCCAHEGQAYDDYIFSLVRKYISPEPTVNVYIS